MKKEKKWAKLISQGKVQCAKCRHFFDEKRIYRGLDPIAEDWGIQRDVVWCKRCFQNACALI